MNASPNTSEQARREPFGSRRNLANLALMVGVGLPWLGVIAWLAGVDRVDQHAPGLVELLPLSAEHLAASSAAHPIALVNALFFVNVCVLFWLISLAQKSTWLIDPYWTILPLLMAHTYQVVPGSSADPVRAATALALLWVWSIRLTHNYFRREEWRFGWREDWRFDRFRRRYPRHWWWLSLPVTYLAQQVMLVGLCLPFYAIFSSPEPFGWLDAIASAGCLAGIVIAAVADNQLRRFMLENERRVAAGEPKVLLLDSGLWRWSRHPNYVGEQLFWWSLALYGVVLGMPWVIGGTVINTLVLARVTVMTERRMLADPTRADLYRAYQQRTGVWLPTLSRAGSRLA